MEVAFIYLSFFFSHSGKGVALLSPRRHLHSRELVCSKSGRHSDVLKVFGLSIEFSQLVVQTMISHIIINIVRVILN